MNVYSGGVVVIFNFTDMPQNRLWIALLMWYQTENVRYWHDLTPLNTYLGRLICPLPQIAFEGRTETDVTLMSSKSLITIIPLKFIMIMVSPISSTAGDVDVWITLPMWPSFSVIALDFRWPLKDKLRYIYRKQKTSTMVIHDLSSVISDDPLALVFV